jgi:GntR family transcriptional regulator
MRRIARKPLSTKTREVIVAAIRDGEFPDGRLPAEHDLAFRLGVSRTTIRAALQALELDGLVVRRRGVGTHVLDRSTDAFQLELTRLGSLDDLFRERGHVPSTAVLSVEIKVLPDVAAKVALPADTEWHVVVKLQQADEQPAILLTDHIPRSIIPDLPPNGEAVDDIFRLFAEFGPAQIVLARVELMPRLADAVLAERLGIADGDPYLRLWQRHYGEGNRFFSVSQLDVNDNFVQFEIVRTN